MTQAALFEKMKEPGQRGTDPIKLRAAPGADPPETGRSFLMGRGPGQPANPKPTAQKVLQKLLLSWTRWRPRAALSPRTGAGAFDFCFATPLSLCTVSTHRGPGGYLRHRCRECTNRLHVEGRGAIRSPRAAPRRPSPNAAQTIGISKGVLTAVELHPGDLARRSPQEPARGDKEAPQRDSPRGRATR